MRSPFASTRHRSPRRLAGLCLLPLALAACDSDRIPPPLYVVVDVFADWNGNGTWDRDDAESGLLDIVVEVNHAVRNTTDTDGRALFAVSPGSVEVSIVQAPPHYVTTTISEARSGDANAEVKMFTVGLRPNLAASRLAFKYVLTGDSLTYGLTFSAQHLYVQDGFDAPLEALLTTSLGRAVVVNRGVSGTKSSCGPALVASRLAAVPGYIGCTCVKLGCPYGWVEDADSADRPPAGAPGYVLILFGTNDLVDGRNCVDERCEPAPDACDALRHIEQTIDAVLAAGAIPVIGTVPPGYKDCDPAWNVLYTDLVYAFNVELHALAERKQVLLADYWQTFVSDATPPVAELISDTYFWTSPGGVSQCGSGLHPTPEGYDLMAQTVWATITGNEPPYAPAPVALRPHSSLDAARHAYSAYVAEEKPSDAPAMSLGSTPGSLATCN